MTACNTAHAAIHTWGRTASLTQVLMQLALLLLLNILTATQPTEFCPRTEFDTTKRGSELMCEQESGNHA